MYFQSNIKYTQQDEQGRQKTINESYLFNALDYTDAETQTHEHIAQNWPDFQLIAIKKQNFQEVFLIENGDEAFYKAKVSYLTFNEATQTDKKTSYWMLLNAEGVREAYESLRSRLGPINDYEIESVIKTNILEVVPNQTTAE